MRRVRAPVDIYLSDQQVAHEQGADVMETTDTDRITADTPTGHTGGAGAGTTDDHRHGGDSVAANQAKTPDGSGGTVTSTTEAAG